MKTILSFLLVLFGLTLSAQNYLMTDGRDAFHFAGGFTDGEASRAFALIPGYTFNGRLTLTCAIGREQGDFNGIEATNIQPSIGYLILRQGTLPFSLEGKANYIYSNITDFDSVLNGYSLGGVVYHQLNVRTAFQVHAGFGMAWNRATSNTSGFELTLENTSYSALLAFMFNDWYFRPSYNFNDNAGAWNFELGYIF